MKRKIGFAHWEFCAGFGVYDAKAGNWIEPLKEALLSNKSCSRVPPESPFASSPNLRAGIVTRHAGNELSSRESWLIREKQRTK